MINWYLSVIKCQCQLLNVTLKMLQTPLFLLIVAITTEKFKAVPADTSPIAIDSAIAATVVPPEASTDRAPPIPAINIGRFSICLLKI